MADIVLRVLDTRIGARFDKPKPSDIIVGSATKLDKIIDGVVKGVGANKLRTLSVCCHGYEAGVADERTAKVTPSSESPTSLW